jgi:hypothetical protein
MRIGDKLENRVQNKLYFNGLMFIIFNILFVLIALALSLILYLVDFLSPWF